MEEPQTPYDFKELFIEIGARTRMEDSMSEAVSPNNLVAMSMLDSGYLESLETSLYSGPDLLTSLRHEISGYSREKWIEAQLRSVLRNPIVANEISRLLDEDLKGAGKPGLIGGGIQLMLKARAIACYRVRNTISFMQQPSHSTGSGNTSTFTGILRYLVGGHGGNRRESVFYFNYSTSFPLFQIVLRDATQLSTIPPIDLDQQISTKEENSPSLSPDTSSQISSIHYGRQIEQGGSDRGSESSQKPHSFVSPVLGSKDFLDQQVRPKPCRASTRGYTIDDGPWLYYLGRKGQARNEHYEEIKDEDSYLKMVDRIREVSRKDESNEYYVVLFHSMDRKASDKWDLLRQEEADAEKRFQKACRRGEISGVTINVKDDNDEIDEDDIGEPYLQWLAKDIACQKREKPKSQWGN